MNETPPVDIAGIKESVESIFCDIASFIRAHSLKEAFAHENQGEKLLKDSDCRNAFSFISPDFLQKYAYGTVK